MAWTHFYDMHSGGGRKEGPYEHIFIESSEDEAITIFYNRFGHNPRRVSCTCCGEDYSISQSDTLHAATYCERTKGLFGVPKGMTVEEYGDREEVLYIPESDIKPEEREGDVPTQGYVYL